MKKLVLTFLFSALLCVFLITSAFAASVWDGTVSDSLSGEGTSDSPFLISSASDLALLSSEAASDSFENCYFSLTDDIILNDETAFVSADGKITSVSDNSFVWTPIGSFEHQFSGIFNGGGHSISGIVSIKESSFSGLFGYLSGAEISNLSIYSSYIECVSYAGLLCAKASDAAYIHDVTVSGRVAGQKESLSCYAGGICGTLSSDSVLESCCSYAYVTGSKSFSSYVGGLVGINYGELSYSTFSGNVSGVPSYYLCTVGGIAGDNKGIIAYCRSNGKVEASTETTLTDCYAGGISGQNSAGEILSCKTDAASDVSASDNSDSNSVCGAGGIVGNNVDGKITGCYVLGKVSAVKAYAGGISAINLSTKGQSEISDCLNSSSVSSENGVAGGIVGINSASEYITNKAHILNCINTSVCTGDAAGGISGLISVSGSAVSSIENCITVSDCPDENGTSVTNASLTSGNTPDGYDASIWSFESGKLPYLAFADGMAKKPSAITAKNNQGVKYTGTAVHPIAASDCALTFSDEKTDMGIYSCTIKGTENDEFFAPAPIYVTYAIVKNPSETQIFAVKPTLKVMGSTASGTLDVTLYCPEEIKNASLVLSYSKEKGYISTVITNIAPESTISTCRITISALPAANISNSDINIYLFDSMENIKPLGDVCTARFSDITSDAYINVDDLFGK